MKINKEKFAFYFEKAKKDIENIVSIPSIGGKPKKGMPYGEDNYKVLEYVLNLGTKLGFDSTFGHNNEYGYIDFGTGEKLFGIVAHLDVVPSGDLSKWDTSPWELIEKDGKLIGRGVLDDKGPAIINLYALKYLKDELNFEPKDYKIRIILGLTEETTWESIMSYKKHEQDLDIGYTPDGQWPVIHAEKSIYDFDIVGSGIDHSTIKGLGAYNMVCDQVIFENEKIKELYSIAKNNDFEVEMNDNITFKGKSAHGSTPFYGDNAIYKMAYTMSESSLPKVELNNFILENFKEKKYKFENIFKNWQDDSGEVTVNLGIYNGDKNETRAGFNARLPISYTQKQAEEAINNYLHSHFPNLKLESKSWEKAKYLPLDDDFIKTLTTIYQEVTGETDAKPIAIGGGTYARAFDNIVAFGACKSIEFMHSINEHISLKELEEMFLIYIKAIYKLVT